MQRPTFLHTPLFWYKSVSHLLPKQQNLEFYGRKSISTEVFLNQIMVTSHHRIDIKNSKYIARDSTLQINMLYGTILFEGTIQGKT
jgi:hypothetical protein